MNTGVLMSLTGYLQQTNGDDDFKMTLFFPVRRNKWCMKHSQKTHDATVDTYSFNAEMQTAMNARSSASVPMIQMTKNFRKSGKWQIVIIKA